MLPFYFAIACTSFRRQLIYRWANLAGLATNIFFGSIFSAVLVALYQARSNVNGYELMDTLRYTWIVQTLIMMVVPFGWSELMQTIRTGEVISDLSKPCDFYGYWFAREAGRSCYYMLFRGLPTYVCGALIWQLGVPGAWWSWLLFLPVLLFATMTGIAYRFLSNVFAFWTLEARSLLSLFMTIALFASGSYVPTPLMPDWLQEVLVWLPFHSLLSLPSQVLLARVSGWDYLFELLRMLAWLGFLTWIARWLTQLASRRVISQGG